MDLLEYGWVSKKDNPLSWENGMKWLSRAIVSDNDETDKQELKRILEVHLRAGYAHPRSVIRQLVVFYSLCWKRIDLLSEHWEALGAKEMLHYLNEALSRMYSNYPTLETSFSIFLDQSPEICLQSISSLIVEKRVEVRVLERIQKGLLSSSAGSAERSVRIIQELVELLDMDRELFRPLLEPFFVRRCAEFQAAVSQKDWHWCSHFLKLMEPVRKILLAYGLGEELHRSLRGFFFCTPAGSFQETFIHLLRWKFPKILRDYIQQTRDPAATGLLASVAVSYLELDASLVPSYTALFDLLIENGWEKLYAYFRLLESGEQSSPVLEEYLEQRLFAADPVTLYRRDQDSLYSLYRGMALILGDLPNPPPAIKQLKQRFLKSIWDTVVTSSRHTVWREALAMLQEMTVNCRDPFIEGEFFLPLMKEGLFSASSMISREVITFAAEKPNLKSVLLDWAGDEFVQQDLMDKLRCETRSVRIASLNKLASIYLRLNLRCPFLSQKLAEFQEEFLQGKNDKGYLPPGALRLVEKMIDRLGAC